MANKIKSNKKKDKEEKIDKHVACFSYPDCDLAPTGCYYTGLSYDEMDHFGHRG